MSSKQTSCVRCGQCCMKVGPTFWVHSEHPFVRAIVERKRKEGTLVFDDSELPCQMLAQVDGRWTCILEYLFDWRGKPNACLQFPFEHGDCKGQTPFNDGMSEPEILGIKS